MSTDNTAPGAGSGEPDTEAAAWVGWPDESDTETGWASAVPAATTPSSAAPAVPRATPSPVTHPARLALGVAVLAAERLRAAPASDTFVVGVGLAQQTVAEIRGIAERAMRRPARAASRTLDWASRQARVGANRGLFARSRAVVGQIVGDARRAGTATVAAGREDANAFLRASVADGMAWAETQAVPRIVDSLVPHLVDSVVPRLIDGVMPEIRERVLPVVVDDLTNDPRVRDLVMEQSRGVVGEAAQHVRSATATADDRVEQAFRRLVGGGTEKGQPQAGENHSTSHDG